MTVEDQPPAGAESLPQALAACGRFPAVSPDTVSAALPHCCWSSSLLLCCHRDTHTQTCSQSLVLGQDGDISQSQNIIYCHQFHVCLRHSEDFSTNSKFPSRKVVMININVNSNLSVMIFVKFIQQ